VKFSLKMDEKMTRDILVDPLPPMSFGDTVVTPRRPPPWSVTYYLNDPIYQKLDELLPKIASNNLLQKFVAGPAN